VRSTTADGGNRRGRPSTKQPLCCFLEVSASACNPAIGGDAGDKTNGPIEQLQRLDVRFVRRRGC
jgi:hypothetical protein